MGRPVARLVRGEPRIPGVLAPWRWDRPVPLIPSGLLNCSVFLYPSEEDAKAGKNTGGSGCLMGQQSSANPAWVHLYVVSNEHVVRRCPVVRLVKTDGTVFLYNPGPLPGARTTTREIGGWIVHPHGDDIAVLSMSIGLERDWDYLATAALISQADVEAGRFSVGPGDDCLMIGRYIDQAQRQFDRPVVRFGNVAMMPAPIWRPTRAQDEVSFLIDLRSQPGYSGSPVLVYYGGIDLLRVEGGDAFVDQRNIMGTSWVLGINWGTLPVYCELAMDTPTRGHFEILGGGLAGVVPAWKVAELLEEDDLKKPRDEAEAELVRPNP